ncbi:hypothetical protein K504DRAFT_189895 [Pleomassaria siparia CBS 279.74]|uniref:Uncharacterized protein n=1 Tax=Pleomassaria siparia CBS 279.74 TaxID=1314801 RepID=A0A6G1JQA5_9PLEO|nr:hypothetical protein K504DRAFT_189895 [Pleomassaria siparia CBS 279.74]
MNGRSRDITDIKSHWSNINGTPWERLLFSFPRMLTYPLVPSCQSHLICRHRHVSLCQRYYKKNRDSRTAEEDGQLLASRLAIPWERNIECKSRKIREIYYRLGYCRGHFEQVVDAEVIVRADRTYPETSSSSRLQKAGMCVSSRRVLAP